MEKIIVAGAGHGGLVAAARLANAGFDVTVYDKITKDGLGHDWEDRFTFELLNEICGIDTDKLSTDIWRYKGDCAFVSPSKKKKVIINYDDSTRQKIMWRKPLIQFLVDYAADAGVNFEFETEIKGPLVSDNKVTGISTSKGEIIADMVIDSCGAFSPVRCNLPDEFGIEKLPKRGDLFYAWRAYFNKSDNVNPDVPFEVYMYHECEQGLSWCNTNPESVDILIGRIDKLDDAKVDEQLELFRKDHPWIGNEILHGGNYGVIPVRKPLTLMVCNGYAAVGDSAFMTMPMNGMGIDLSIKAGKMLADTIIAGTNFSADILWKYNKKVHKELSVISSKNEGLKNSILSMPYYGVDFLFENEVIQSSDLAGAGRNTSFASLLGKFKRGMAKPEYFFKLIGGLIKGAKTAKLYANPPEKYDLDKIRAWSDSIEKNKVKII